MRDKLCKLYYAKVSKTSCCSNLKMLDGAKGQWAAAGKKTNGTSVTMADLQPLLPGVPECPRGGTYTIGKIGEAARCSIPEHRYP